MQKEIAIISDGNTTEEINITGDSGSRLQMFMYGTTFAPNDVSVKLPESAQKRLDNFLEELRLEALTQ